MKFYEIVSTGDVEALKINEREIPTVNAGQALVKVYATSLNYRDHIILQGKISLNTIPGLIPLSDGAGEVVAVGEGVESVKVGDRVAGNFFEGWVKGRFNVDYHATAFGGAIDGWLTEYIAVSADALAHIPEHLSYEEAATLPCAALTAWNSLFTRGNLEAGQTVLTQGTGGVSIFALQFSKAAGAKVIITSSSDEKLEQARRLGADETINYKKNPDWDKEAIALTNNKGVDQVIELGGPETYDKSISVLAGSGHLAQVGVLSGFDIRPVMWPLAVKNATVSGIYVGSKTDFEAMNRFINQHKLKPVIDRVFSFKEAKEAYKYLASGSHFGKIVITI